MKRVCAFVCSSAAVLFCAMAVWGQLITGEVDGFSVVALYIAVPFLTLVCATVVSLEYRFGGFFVAAACFVATLALHFATFGDAELAICAVTGALPAVLGTGLGILLRKGKDRLRTAYKFLLVALNAAFCAAGTALQYLALALLLLVVGINGANGGTQTDWLPLILLQVGALLAHFLVSLAGNLILYKPLKKSLNLTKKHLFYPILISLGATILIIAAILLISAII